MDFSTDMIIGALKSAAIINAALAALGFLLPNKVIKKAGYGVGVAMSKVFRQRLGKNAGEKAEGYFQGTLNAFVEGLNEGADADDSQ